MSPGKTAGVARLSLRLNESQLLCVKMIGEYRKESVGLRGRRHKC